VKIADGEPRKRAITIYFKAHQPRAKLAGRTKRKHCPSSVAMPRKRERYKI